MMVHRFIKRLICMPVMLLMLLACGCSEESMQDEPERPDVPDGDPWWVFIYVDFRMPISIKGGEYEVNYFIPSPIVYATTHGDFEFMYLHEDGLGGFFDYPEGVEFHSDDLINLAPSNFLWPYVQNDKAYEEATESMLASGATILERAKEFQFEWLHVTMSEPEHCVKLSAMPNDTGKIRRIYLVALPIYKYEPNNVLVITQKGTVL